MMDKAAFYAHLRKRDSGVFGTSLRKSQVMGTEGILDAFEEVGDGRVTTLAYALGTVYGETGRRMVPVREGFAQGDAGARAAVNKLAEARGPGSAVAKYAKPQPPYGHVYYGRGHVQLTWINNYRDSSADAGVDLVKNPDAMLDPKISARVLIRGLMDGRWNRHGKSVFHYEMLDGVPGLSEIEAVAARRTVNVQDKASEYAGFYRSFRAALVEAGMVDKAPGPRPPAPRTPAPKPPVLLPPQPAPAASGDATPGNATPGNATPGNATPGNAAPAGIAAASVAVIVAGLAYFWGFFQ